MKRQHISLVPNILIILFLLTFLLLQISCDSTSPPSEKPPGYQEDIPWPSLADSPWPMYHHDPQSTGRSKFLSPTQGTVSNIIPTSWMESGISIGFDSSIYFTFRSSIVASNYDGNIKWLVSSSRELPTTPLIGADTTIYIATGVGKSILAINNDGSLKWEYTVGADIWNASLGIDKDGNIYFIDNDRNLTVLTKDGSLKWQINDQRFLTGSHVAFSFSPDGDYLYVQGSSVSLLAIDVFTQTISWTFGDRKLDSGVLVDSQGNIYIFPEPKQDEDNYFYSLKPDGEIRWQFQHKESFITSNIESAIDRNGNIYFGYKNLYSLNYEGELRWEVDLDGYRLNAPILVDNLDNIFLILLKTDGINKVISFNNAGQTNWELQIDDPREISSSAAISENGLLFVPSWRENSIYVIR